MVDFELSVWAVAVSVAVFAGAVKGIVGFALPMVMISGLALVMSPDLALASLILPTLAGNAWQALRGGAAAAWRAAREHWLYILVLWVMIAVSAQMIYVLPEAALYLILGIPVTAFALFQLLGLRFQIARRFRRLAEVTVGAFSGFIGGLSGVWGPPTVAYLTALDTEKAEQVRIQGVIYGTGSVVLLFSHIRSGVMSWETAPLSAAFLVPVMVGMLLGFRIQDRIDQEAFRKVTLAVLVVAGLNLIRRGVTA